LPGQLAGPFDHAANFIHLGSKKQREKSPVPAQDYRDISRKPGRDDEELDSDLESASDSDTVPAFDDPMDLAIRAQNANLARRCKDEPGSLENWLEFIAYQDKMIRLGSYDKSAELNDAECRSLAGVKISIYKDALAKTKDDSRAQETLWLGLLSEGAHVWDSQSQHKKWDQAVESNPKSAKILVGRLNSIQCDASTFRYGTHHLEVFFFFANLVKTGVELNT
jgi:hypothetical protein